MRQPQPVSWAGDKVLARMSPKPEARKLVIPVLAHCQLATKPLRLAVCSAKKVTALPNSPPTENPCNRRAKKINSGAASPIDA